MSRKVVFILSLFFLLSFLLCVRFSHVEVKASNGYHVHNLNTGYNYTTIQEAIDDPETSNGHTIFVEEGVYYEHLTLNKSLTIIGENRNTTIIDGNGTGTVVYVITSNVTIRNFTMQNGYVGIRVWNCSNIIIDNNDVAFNKNGIYMDWNCYNNQILNNRIHDNGFPQHWQAAGLHITGSGNEANRPHNTIISNNIMCKNNIGFWMEQCVNTTMRDNRIDSSHYYSFGVMGRFEDDFQHNIDTSNTVDEKPVYYIVNQNGIEISQLGEVGFMGIVNCTNVTLHDIDLRGNSYVGMQIAHVQNSTIANITIQNSFYSMYVEFSSRNLFSNINVSNNFRGIGISNSNENTFLHNSITNNEELAFSFYESSDNIFQENRIENNHYALTFYRSACNEISENNIIGHQFGDSYAVSFYEGSSNNLFYHNNLINNTRQVINYIAFSNFWDNGLEGNYIDDYNGVDLDHDGIGDTEHTIDVNNVDRFPLMGMFLSFSASSCGQVNVISNSTLEDFQYFEFNRTIKIVVSNMTTSQTYGFCRICIPHALMTEPYYVTVDGVEPYYVNYTLHNNGTHSWIYVSYLHSTHEIIIVGEFPSALILPVFMVATTLILILYKRACLIQCTLFRSSFMVTQNERGDKKEIDRSQKTA